MKQPTAGVIPLIAIIFGSGALTAAFLEAYFAAFLIVNFGLLFWFALMSHLCESSDPPQKHALYFTSLCLIGALVTGFSVFSMWSMAINNAYVAVKMMLGIILLTILSYRAWPQLRTSLHILFSSAKNES